MSEKKVSIVMCTFNGMPYLKEQLQTVVMQTYPSIEVIIQDDGSTDGTLDTIKTFQKKYSFIKLYHNDGEHGVNGNFFSAMFRATGDYIAICDQDDIWELNKIEKMMNTIGGQLLCSCRTQPFSEDGSPVGYDSRVPNYRLPRLLYASVLGHSMLFRRSLLNKLPDLSNGYYGTIYDVILGTTAAACGKIEVCNEILVHQRRHANATTVSKYDHEKRRTPSMNNGLYILMWSLLNYRRVRPHICDVFKNRLSLLENIKGAHSEEYKDAVQICQLEGVAGIANMMKLSLLFIKNRHYLFYTEGRGIVNYMRAMLFPIMQAYNYRHLLP